jgi:hypothetical protein
MRWMVHVAQVGEMRGAYGVLVRKPKGRRPLEKLKLTLEDYIKIGLEEI